MNFYCSNTKLTANIVQVLCLFLTHTCSSVFIETQIQTKFKRTKLQTFDFSSDHFAVGLTVGVFLRGSVSESLISKQQYFLHWCIFLFQNQIKLKIFLRSTSKYLLSIYISCTWFYISKSYLYLCMLKCRIKNNISLTTAIKVWLKQLHLLYSTFPWC